MSIETKNLYDGYATQGDSLDGFNSAIAEMDAITRCRKIGKGDDIVVYALCEIPSIQVEDEVALFEFTRDSLESFEMEGKRLTVRHFSKEKLFGSTEEAAYLEEEFERTGLIISINMEKYIVSELCLQTLLQRCAVSGEMTFNRQNFYRNAHLADALFARGEYIMMVYREVGGIKKAFAALTTGYQYVPQELLCQIFDTIRKEGILGYADVKHWLMDQNFTNLYVEFPDMQEDFLSMSKGMVEGVIPGIVLMTSDTGSCSVICRSTFRKEGSKYYVILDEIAKKHTKGLCKEDVLTAVNDQIFANIRRLPETLAMLSGYPVLDYDTVDITTASGRIENLNTVRDLYSSCIMDVLKDTGKLGKSRCVELLTQLSDEINPSTKYSMLDVALTFMDIMDRVDGLDNVTKVTAQKACAKVPFYLEKNLGKKKKKEEGSLVLLPA